MQKESHLVEMTNFVLGTSQVLSRLGGILTDVLLRFVQLVDHLQILASS